MPSHHERITRALDLLTAGLYPFVEREMKKVFRERWLDAARESFRRGRGPALADDEALKWDAHALLTVMWDQWNTVFRNSMGFVERSIVSELREFRNDWAHQRPFDFDDTYRLLDSVQRLLTAAGDADRAYDAATGKRELLREQFVVQEDVAGRRERFERHRWFLLGLYVVCGLLIVSAIANTFGWDAWHVAVLVVVTFGYFSYNLLRHRPRLVADHDRNLGSLVEYSADEPLVDDSPIERPTSAV